MTPILSLDLATSTGWALRCSQGRVTSGTQTFQLNRGESAGMRFLRFRAWLREVMGLAGRWSIPQAARVGAQGVLAYEAAHHRGGHATALCVGLVTVALEEAAAQGWETTSVHTGTLKKHATGMGSASKAEMLMAARLRWPGLAVTGEDEADALCVLSWALEQIGEARWVPEGVLRGS